MKVYKLIYIFTVLITFFLINNVLFSQSRIELSFQMGYSVPLLEAYGTNVELSADERTIRLSGERWFSSANFGAEKGFTVQTYFKYSFLKSGLIKGLFNLGYNVLNSSHQGSKDTYGVRLQSFSLGIGPEINPIGTKKFYPSLFVMLRMNLIGGETYYGTGFDFLKVVPRYGYSGGLKLNYNLNNRTGLFAGYSYNYDNTWGKETEEVMPRDENGHLILLRDKASATNGLKGDRRIAYSSYFLGMNFYIR